MRKFILTICFCLMASFAFGEKVNEFTDINIDEVKLHKWDNEVDFKIKSSIKTTVLKEGQKYKQKKEKVEVHVYDLGNDELEYEFYLTEIPASNVFSLDIESKGLEFLYQPELTQEEKDNGYFRPENVIGSYAVYHESKKNNKYKTGKAFHIYRPKAIDDNGAELWCEYNSDLKIKKKIEITCDSTWLDNATYPVVIDPTIGKTDLGASEAQTANTSIGSLDTVNPSDGTLTKAYWGGRSTGGTSVPISVAVHEDNSTQPTGALVGFTTSFSTTNTTKAWHPAPSPNGQTITGTVSSAKLYWVSFFSNAGAGSYAYDTGGVSGQNYYAGSSAWETWDDPQTSHTDSSVVRSVYVEYTESGGGAATNTYLQNIILQDIIIQ